MEYLTHLGGGIPKPPRQKMGNRRRAELFTAFERWGWDERSWAKTTRYYYVMRAKAADRWLSANCNTYLVWASADHLRQFLSTLPAEAGHRNNYRVALVGFFEFCRAQGWRPDNPASELARLKVPRPLPKALDVDQALRIDTMADTFDPQHRAVILLLLYGGLRRAELRGLQWRDVRPGWITVTGKGSKERDVPLHPRAEDALMMWKMRSDEAQWVFSLKPGRPMSFSHIYVTVRELGEVCGMPGLHPHQLRHTAATWLMETGADLRTVQTFLGHGSPQSTAIYTAVRPARLRDAVARMKAAGDQTAEP